MTRSDIIERLKRQQVIIDAHTHVGISISNYLASASYPYALSFEDLVVRMDALGIDSSIVFPFESSYYPLFGEDKPLDTPARSSFPYEKENLNLFQEIFDVFPEYAERAIPFAMFDPSRETAKQAAALEELHNQYPLCGLKTLTTYTKSFVKDFQRPSNEIRAFAIKHQLPITFHCSWFKDDIWANVFDVLDIAEANPEINIALAHSARFSKVALDRAAALPNCFVDISAFKIHCDLAAEQSEFVACGDDAFAADYSNPEETLQQLAETYPETILWGSDTPYHYFAQKYIDQDGKTIDCRLYSKYDREIKILQSLPAELRQEIDYNNIIKFLQTSV
jgi:predicted TIM-barrel fold metal-dependent hydrolase